jgi:hypothetical protein
MFVYCLLHLGILIDTVFLGCIDHGMQASRVAFIRTGTQRQDVSAAFSADLDEFTAVLFNFLRIVRVKLCRSNVTGYTGSIAQYLLGFEHVRLFHRPNYRGARQFTDDSQSIFIIFTVNNHHWNAAFVNDSQEELAESRPLKLLELLDGYKAVIALVHRD